MILSRRGILRCLTGIIAAPAVVKADALMRVVGVPRLAYDGLGNEFESYVGYFREQEPLVQSDWRWVARISNVGGLGEFGGYERLLLPALSDERPEGAIAARKLRLG